VEDIYDELTPQLSKIYTVTNFLKYPPKEGIADDEWITGFDSM
jgi:hypothetical protein